VAATDIGEIQKSCIFAFEKHFSNHSEISNEISMKKIMTALAVAATLSACTSQQPKMLVLYYSQEGTTQKVAEQIAAELGADIERFDVEEPYTGNFQETIERCLKEREEGISPKVKPIASDISKYDIIFLGYPIWFGTYAPPVAALLKDINLDGKVVVPFCTFGSGGLYSSTADLQQAIPGAEVRDGFGIRSARIDKLQPELERFLVIGGYKEGEVESYPDYSEQMPVTEEQVAIFDAACSDYQFPLGTPISVGTRETSSSVDYLFTVESMGRDGNPAQSKIYVTVPKSADARPEFTIVVR
jgi:flavodoxin